MWILDCSAGKRIKLWMKDGNRVRKVEFDYKPYFYLHVDACMFRDLIEGLESRYRVEECSFKTIYGELEGFRVHCPANKMRRVAELIEIQTKFRAKLYNIDVRLDQRWLAENSLFPAGNINESNEDRFNPDFACPLKIVRIFVKGEKNYPASNNRITKVRFNGEAVEGREKTILEDLSSLLDSHDPDVILLPHADYWVPFMLSRAKRHGIDLKISRANFKRLSGKSYQSYGRTRYRPSACLPEGRILIDTAGFNYKEGGLKGILLASRLTGIPPNYAARFTPGTLISSYEVYEALRRDIAVPFRKFDAENTKSFEELKRVDRGGMIFQPEPGLYEDVIQLDFTSMYPSITVKYNLSPETVGRDAPGFLSEVLRPLLELRFETKRRKKNNPEFKKLDSILKWMLVTCFGYTGYKNARFGRIDVHESITAIGREILLRTKEIAESMGFEVIHGIVDCLWLKGENIEELKRKVEGETGLRTDFDRYDWIVFLPMKDNTGAYNRYYGRLSSGKMKLRGVVARRSDFPTYVRHVQLRLFNVLAKARSSEEIADLEEELLKTYSMFRSRLEKGVNPKLLAIERRISKLSYSKRCFEASAVKAYEEHGVKVLPGMSVACVVVDAKRWVVEVPWMACDYDTDYYLRLLEKAWDEIWFAIRCATKQTRKT